MKKLILFAVLSILPSVVFAAENSITSQLASNDGKILVAAAWPQQTQQQQSCYECVARTYGGAYTFFITANNSRDAEDIAASLAKQKDPYSMFLGASCRQSYNGCQ